MKTIFILIALLFSVNTFASSSDWPIEKFTECQFTLDIVKNFNGDENALKDFNDTFGGANSFVIEKTFEGIRTGYIKNKNEGLALQAMFMWNYYEKVWYFVGASVVGPVTGIAKDCTN